MKNLFILWFLFSFLTSIGKAQTISTFNNHTVHYGWNDQKSFSEKELQNLLRQCFTDNISELDIQSKVDAAGIKAELLWKISGDLNQVTEITKNTVSSWIWDNAKPTRLSIVFHSSGSGYIYLYQNDTRVGVVRCHTSPKREGNKYLQLEERSYVVKDKELLHVSKEKGLEGSQLKHALFSGVDGKWIHEGELAPSHGCVRVSKPCMIELYRLVPEGMPFTVIHKE